MPMHSKGGARLYVEDWSPPQRVFDELDRMPGSSEVERPPVKRDVAGSSPALAAIQCVALGIGTVVFVVGAVLLGDALGIGGIP